MSQTTERRVSRLGPAERRLYEAFREVGLDADAALTATEGHREELSPDSPDYYRRFGVSESAANMLARGAPLPRTGLSKAAARILEAGAPPRSPLLDSGRPPAANVGRTDADWARVREAARRAGAQPPAWNESGMSDDERRFNDLVVARERRGMSFREAIAEAEAAIHRVTREKDSR